MIKTEYPDCRAVSHTIYNEKAILRKKKLQDLPPIFALLQDLKNVNFKYSYRVDSENRVNSLLFSHETSYSLAQMFPYVLLIDATYRTNRFSMPIIHFVGVTSRNSSFTMGVAFVSKETTDFYCWALHQLHSLFQKTLPEIIVTDRELALPNALPIVFPTAHNLLCRWHINRNILANCKKYFRTEDGWLKFYTEWLELIDASTVNDFQ